MSERPVWADILRRSSLEDCLLTKWTPVQILVMESCANLTNRLRVCHVNMLRQAAAAAS